MGVNIFVRSWGNDSPIPDAAAACYDPKVNYTGTVLEFYFLWFKRRLCLIIKDLPDAINRLGFKHDSDVGNYERPSCDADNAYFDGVLLFAATQTPLAAHFWMLYATNARIIIRSWGEFRYSLNRIGLNWK